MAISISSPILSKESNILITCFTGLSPVASVICSKSIFGNSSSISSSVAQNSSIPFEIKYPKIESNSLPV